MLERKLANRYQEMNERQLFFNEIDLTNPKITNILEKLDLLYLFSNLVPFSQDYQSQVPNFPKDQAAFFRLNLAQKIVNLGYHRKIYNTSSVYTADMKSKTGSKLERYKLGLAYQIWLRSNLSLRDSSIFRLQDYSVDTISEVFELIIIVSNFQLKHVGLVSSSWHYNRICAIIQLLTDKRYQTQLEKLIDSFNSAYSPYIWYNPEEIFEAVKTLPKKINFYLLTDKANEPPVSERVLSDENKGTQALLRGDYQIVCTYHGA